MLTVEKLHKIANEAFKNDEWLCVLSGKIFNITKLYSQEDVEELVACMSDVVCGEDEDASILDSEGFIYTDAATAKDWNYFKNTMLV